MKKILIATLSTLMYTSPQAKVLIQDTGVNIGWMQEITSSSKASGQYSRNFLTTHHRSVTDWGMIFVKGQMENVGATSDDLNDNEGDVWFKAMATVHYNLGDTGLMAWYDLFVNQNQRVAEVHNVLGIAYKYKQEKLVITGGVGINYFSGHTPLGRVEGLITSVARIAATYPISKNLNTFIVVNTHLNRDTNALENSFASWGKTGHQLLAGVSYTFAPKWDLNLTYRKFDNWGGYGEGGESVVTTVGFHF